MLAGRGHLGDIEVGGRGGERVVANESGQGRERGRLVVGSGLLGLLGLRPRLPRGRQPSLGALERTQGGLLLPVAIPQMIGARVRALVSHGSSPAHGGGNDGTVTVPHGRTDGGSTAGRGSAIVVVHRRGDRRSHLSGEPPGRGVGSGSSAARRRVRHRRPGQRHLTASAAPLRYPGRGGRPHTTVATGAYHRLARTFPPNPASARQAPAVWERPEPVGARRRAPCRGRHD